MFPRSASKLFCHVCLSSFLVLLHPVLQNLCGPLHMSTSRLVCLSLISLILSWLSKGHAEPNTMYLQTYHESFTKWSLLMECNAVRMKHCLRRLCTKSRVSCCNLRFLCMWHLLNPLISSSILTIRRCSLLITRLQPTELATMAWAYVTANVPLTQQLIFRLYYFSKLSQSIT